MVEKVSALGTVSEAIKAAREERRASPPAHDSTIEGRLSAIEERLDKLEELVGGRNKSAATKRNMTDVDALSVLTGEFREYAHKEAAELAGLTYAQVYSCRCEFTFKHVHKDLRKASWKNPWAR